MKMDIDILSWKDVHDKFLKADPELTSIIDELDPNDRMKFINLRYPYGAKIYENGVFYLPTEKGSLPLNHPDILAQLKNLLGYSQPPLGFVTKNSFEVYQKRHHLVSPMAFRRIGLELGIWETFATASPYTVSAGARSIILLPKVTDMANHKNLAAYYGVRSSVPTNPFNLWDILTEIANHNKHTQPWQCEVVFFSGDWLDKMKTDPAWLKFYNYTLKKAWRHTESLRFKVTYDMLWDRFSHFLTKNKVKPNPYIVDTFKHLVFVASGLLPAFTPISADPTIAPIDSFFEAYLERYALKNYCPSFLYSDYFDKKSKAPVYYSLQAATCLDSIARRKNSVSARLDLFELVDLMDRFTMALAQDHLGASSEVLYELFSQVQFDCFHSEDDINRGVNPTVQLSLEDPRFLYLPEKYGERIFCDTCSFVRGCIRISGK